MLKGIENIRKYVRLLENMVEFDQSSETLLKNKDRHLINVNLGQKDQRPVQRQL